MLDNVEVTDTQVIFEFHHAPVRDQFYEWFDTIGKDMFVNWLVEQDDE